MVHSSWLDAAGEKGMIEAVLWDMDGVLVDTSSFHFQAFRELLAAEGREFTPDDFWRTFGLRNDTVLRDLLGDLPEERVAHLSGQKEELFRRMARGWLTALPGAIALLRRLRHTGIKTAIVSSGPRENVEMVLDSLGLRESFDATVAAEDVALGKPAPEGYLLASARLGVEPPACLVLEDAPGGIEAGRLAGMRCVGVSRERDRRDLAVADLVVSTLDDPAVYNLLDAANTT